MTSSNPHPGSPRILIRSSHQSETDADPAPPLTPPPLNHAGSPYARMPLPPVHEHDGWCHHQPVSINPILKFSHKPSLSFNVVFHPSTIITLPERRSLSYLTLSQPATMPPLPCLHITSPFLPWSVTVLPSSHKPNKFVTVSDVLVTLHRTLGLTATWEEWQSLEEDLKATHEHWVSAHTDRRLRESGSCTGVRKVDFLMGRNRFLGLSKMGSLPDVMVLHLS
jgi:hypothetical protein